MLQLKVHTDDCIHLRKTNGMPPRIGFFPSKTACLLKYFFNSIFINLGHAIKIDYLTNSCSWLLTRQETTVAPEKSALY